MLKSLRGRLTLIMIVLAVVPTLIAGGVATARSFTAQREQSQDLQAEVARRVAGEVEQFLAERTRSLELVAQVGGLLDLPAEEQAAALSDLLAYDRVFTELALLDPDGQELMRVAQRAVVSPADLANRASEDVFRVPATQQTAYYGPVRIEAATGEPLMEMSLPLVDLRSGEVRLVFAATVRLKPVWNLIADLPVARGQDVYVVDAQSRVVAHRNPSIVLRGTEFAVPDSFGETTGLSGSDVVLAYERVRLGDQAFTVVAELPTSEAYRPAYDVLRTTVIVLAATVLGVAVIGLLIVARVTRPLAALAGAARALGAGNLATRAPESGGVEIGTAARALNDMAGQLGALVGALEDRVEARTHDLRVASTVAQQAAAILDPDELLPQIVELTKESFDLYHAHVYLLNEERDALLLAAGAGEPGRVMLARGHSISLRARSLVARAARENQPVIVADTTQDPNFLPNPLLPDTRSEAAFPLVAGKRVLGVLDVQADVEDRFGPDLLDVFMTLASQIAVALENARLFRGVERATRHEQTLNVIAEQIQRATSLDELIHTTARELGKALRVPHTAIELKLASDDADGHAGQSEESVPAQ
ncbi:MAG: GAF domain-containing protein [Anaerolineae bacterium]|nr:GAF domain-containing protein [Anaerolineae bacterium]